MDGHRNPSTDRGPEIFLEFVLCRLDALPVHIREKIVVKAEPVFILHICLEMTDGPPGDGHNAMPLDDSLAYQFLAQFIGKPGVLHRVFSLDALGPGL